MFEYLITRPMGFLIRMIYDIVQNYGLSIIFFTIIIKLILMPLTIHSQKAMRKQQKLQPYLMELQEKYANDKERLQQATMKLYKDNNVSMTGGCLPMLIQFPILIGLYRVIQKPLTYLLNIDFSLEENISHITDLVSRMVTEFPDVIGKLKDYTTDQLINMSQIQLSTWSQMLNGVQDKWAINFDFLGLDLSVVPYKGVEYLLAGMFTHVDRILLILIPAIAILTTWLSMKQSQAMTKTPENADNPAAQMSKSMNLMMPIMTGFFAFTLPSGLGLYWIISNVMQIVQQAVLNNYFKQREDDFVVKTPEKNRKNGKKR